MGRAAQLPYLSGADRAGPLEFKSASQPHEQQCRILPWTAGQWPLATGHWPLASPSKEVTVVVAFRREAGAGPGS